MELIGDIEANEYHGKKFKVLLRSIANDGRSVIFLLYFMLLILLVRSQNLKRRGNSKAHGFKINLG
jgi:hypothetical protein